VGAIAVTEATFASTIADNHIVLVDWWASWCGPCRMFGPVFEAAAAALPAPALDDLIAQVRALDLDAVHTERAARAS
jgi:thiol-disulfide isomerase/thioredoxin